MRTLNEIRKVGMDALVKSLGPVDAVRFIQQYDQGFGDYSKERHELSKGLTVDDIFSQIEKTRDN